MAKPFKKSKKNQEIRQFVLADVLVDPSYPYWKEICFILGSEIDNQKLKEEFSKLALVYFRDLNVGLYNKGRAKRIARLLTLIDDLTEAICEDKHWLIDKLSVYADDPPEVEAMAEMSVQEILEGESDNVLATLRTMVAHAIDKAEPGVGQEVLRARRRAWIRAAQIYEERLGRRAATSKDLNDRIDANSPFVRFIMFLSRPIMYGDKITPDMIDKFVDWYRSADSERDREEIAEFRMLSAALAYGARG